MSTRTAAQPQQAQPSSVSDQGTAEIVVADGRANDAGFHARVLATILSAGSVNLAPGDPNERERITFGGGTANPATLEDLTRLAEDAARAAEAVQDTLETIGLYHMHSIERAADAERALSDIGDRARRCVTEWPRTLKHPTDRVESLNEMKCILRTARVRRPARAS